MSLRREVLPARRSLDVSIRRGRAVAIVCNTTAAVINATIGNYAMVVVSVGCLVFILALWRARKL